MSDDEATVRHSILSGYIDTLGSNSPTPDEIQDAIMNKVFSPQTVWAVKGYLQEIGVIEKTELE